MTYIDWTDKWPASCSLCNVPLKEEEYFVHGITIQGPIALMCPGCFQKWGKGLGQTVGHKYNSKTLHRVNE